MKEIELLGETYLFFKDLLVATGNTIFLIRLKLEAIQNILINFSQS